MKRQACAVVAVLELALAFAAPAARAQSQAATSDLEKEIVRVLTSLPHYGVFDNLYFEMSGSDVTLEGQALLEITKAEAGKRVARIRGIGGVTNKIEVLPPSPSDDALRFSVFRAIAAASDLNRYTMGADPSIHVIVKGGHVTLEGMVSNADDKQKAEMVTKSLPGIMEFKNNLRTDK
jgi:hypothetical protein